VRGFEPPTSRATVGYAFLPNDQKTPMFCNCNTLPARVQAEEYGSTSPAKNAEVPHAENGFAEDFRKTASAVLPNSSEPGRDTRRPGRRRTFLPSGPGPLPSLALFSRCLILAGFLPRYRQQSHQDRQPRPPRGPISSSWLHSSRPSRGSGSQLRARSPASTMMRITTARSQKWESLTILVTAAKC
jgi:hypothetical protein